MIAALLVTLAQDPLVSWRLEPPEVDLGQPFQCVLEVPHAPGDGPTAPDLEGRLDYGWAVVDGPQARAYDGGTRLEWTVLALEAGAPSLPSVQVALAGGGRLVVPATSLDVAGVLDAEQDAPRALPELRTVEERTSEVRPRHLGLALLGLLLLGVGALIVRRRGRTPRVEVGPSELERLGVLDREAERPLAIELAALLRSAAERAAAVEAPRSGLTDREWVGALEHEDALLPEQRAELRSLLEACGLMKFAGARPTRFAVDDLLARAESLLHELAEPPVLAEEAS